jgi:hypothetical protein
LSVSRSNAVAEITAIPNSDNVTRSTGCRFKFRSVFSETHRIK